MLKFFKIPFATAGDKAAIPNDSQPSGSVSYEDGFGPDYELDPGVDPAAKDVPRDETNQLYYDITTAIQEYQVHGVPDFITSALNGGAPYSYDINAMVRWTDDNIYISRVNANTADPSDATKWRLFSDNVPYVAIPTTAFQASVTDGEAVYWTGTEFDEAVADGTSKQNVVGFADVTNGRVFVSGLMAGLLSGLTANTQYYLSPTTPGALTSVNPGAYAVPVCIGRSATDIFVRVGTAGDNNAGEVTMFARNTAPTGYIKANGAAISRTTYAALFAAIGTTFGPGDGSTTFNVPDGRAEFLRGWDDGRGVDTGRVFGSAQGFAMQAHTHTTPQGLQGGGAFAYQGGINGLSTTSGAASGTTATETRPRNLALLACIRY